MKLPEATKESIERTVSWLRDNQDNQGRWLGMHRSTYGVFYYAAALALDNEQPDSDVIQDLCDFVEECATADGGIGDYPGEPASSFQTSLFVPFLTWARPTSRALGPARNYLLRHRLEYQEPAIALSRYVFSPESRRTVLADKGPPEMLLRLIVRLSRGRHVSERWSVKQMYPKSYPKKTRLQRFVESRMMRMLTFPSLSNLQDAATYCAVPTGFDIYLLICAALRKLAGDHSKRAQEMYRFTLERRKRFIYGDDYETIALIAGDLLFTQAHGMNEEHQKAVKALRSIEYLGNGWIRDGTVTPYVWETAMTILGLSKVGIKSSDPMVAQAVAYLLRSRSPSSGLWSFGYSATMGDRRIMADTDTSGTVCVALAETSEPTGSPILAMAAEKLSQLQAPSGAFSTWAECVVRPNFCWVSNTSHVLQALSKGGFSLDSAPVERGMSWLLKEQNSDGSWIDGWCSRYIHGTVVAIEALTACGKLLPGDPVLSKAASWLLHQQNPDGGWGEDWSGANAASTAEHTGMALYGLCLGSTDEALPASVLENGIKWLLDHQKSDGTWESCYFMNLGFNLGSAERQLTVSWALTGLGESMRRLAQVPNFVGSNLAS